MCIQIEKSGEIFFLNELASVCFLLFTSISSLGSEMKSRQVGSFDNRERKQINIVSNGNQANRRKRMNLKF